MGNEARLAKEAIMPLALTALGVTLALFLPGGWVAVASWVLVAVAIIVSWASHHWLWLSSLRIGVASTMVPVCVAACLLTFLGATLIARRARPISVCDKEEEGRANQTKTGAWDLVTPYESKGQSEGDKESSKQLCAWQTFSGKTISRASHDDGRQVLAMAEKTPVRLQMDFKSEYNQSIDREMLGEDIQADCMIRSLQYRQVNLDHCGFTPIPPSPTLVATGTARPSSTATPAVPPSATPTPASRKRTR